MSQPSDSWATRRRRWRVERLDPARDRAPERREPFVTLGDIPLEGLYGPWSLEAGAGGPTAVDHNGDPLRPASGPGPWDDFDPARDAVPVERDRS